MNKIFFIADTHFFHTNILKHCPDRLNSRINDVIGHDEWLIDLWNNKIEKKDTVYMVGDFAFGNKERVIRLMGKLNGTKHLIVGNHDASSLKLPNYFESIQQIKDLTFKASLYPFWRKIFIWLFVIIRLYHGVERIMELVWYTDIVMEGLTNTTGKQAIYVLMLV